MRPCIVLLFVLHLITSALAQTQCFPPPNDKNPKECCAIPHVMPQREQFAACMQKFPPPPLSASPPPPGTLPPGANCIAECILTQQGVISNGAINKDVISSQLIALVGSSTDWQALVRRSVDTCYSQVSSLASQKDSNGCSSAAGAFLECLPTDMFKNCPSASWTASDECEQQKAFLARGCSIMALMKGPRH